MKNKQVFLNVDPMKDFKEKKQSSFPNCAFYTSPINSSIDIGSGFYNGGMITESVITDGTISLQKKNLSKPLIIWENHLLTLENGTSISIEISKATFMIDIAKYLGQEQIDIHIEKDDKELLESILNYFYGKQLGLFETSSITFTSPTILVLESIVNGKKAQETIDFNSGIAQYRKKPHRKRY